jgi:hypothetical protein
MASLRRDLATSPLKEGTVMVASIATIASVISNSSKEKAGVYGLSMTQLLLLDH